MSNLAYRHCTPHQGEVVPLRGVALKPFRSELPSWNVVEDHHLEKVFSFKDFNEALRFTNEVGELAEQENHHPDIHLSWGRVRITLWTHDIGGLTENDFILAARIDQLIESE